MKIIKGKKARPRKIEIYGPHGIGKSTAASQAPSPVFLSTEDGLGDIDCDRTPLLKTMAEFNTALLSLSEDDHSYRTVVIDTVDWLERLIWKQVADENDKKSIEEIPYARGYKLALKQWGSVLANLDNLRLRKNMSIILVAHKKDAKVEPPDGEAFTRYEPDLHKTVSPLIMEWADEVLYVGYKVNQISKGEGFDKRHVAVGNGERVCYCTEKPTHLAKNRLNLPDEIPFTWEAYASHVRAVYATYKEPNKAGNIAGVVKDGHSKPENRETK
jgi:hypothetical protein